MYAISTRNTSLLGYLTIPAVSFGSNVYIKDMSNLMSQSQIQLQANNGNVFDTGLTTLTMNTNNQSIHICNVGNGSDGTLLQRNKNRKIFLIVFKNYIISNNIYNNKQQQSKFIKFNK